MEEARRERAPSSELHKRHLSSPAPSSAPPPGAAAPLLSPSGGATARSGDAPPASSSADELALLRHQHHSVLERDFGLHLFGADAMDRLDIALLPGYAHATASLKTAAVAALFVVGTLFYRWAERLSWVDAAYCTAGVVTTVGQVIVPRTAAGRCFTAVFNLASLGLGVLLIMEIADARRDSARRLLRRSVRAGLSPATLEVAALVAATVPTVLAMALAMMVLEGWSSFGEAVYFCLICATGARARPPPRTVVCGGASRAAAGVRWCNPSNAEQRQRPPPAAAPPPPPPSSQGWAWGTWSPSAPSAACCSSPTSSR